MEKTLHIINTGYQKTESDQQLDDNTTHNTEAKVNQQLIRPYKHII